MKSLRSFGRLAIYAAPVVWLAAAPSCAPVTSNKATDNPVVARGQDGPPFDSGVLSPFGSGFDQLFVIDSPPPSETDILLGFVVSAELAADNEYFNVFLNGRDLGRVLEIGGETCPFPAEEVTVRVPAELYNEALQNDGRIEVRMAPSAAVSAPACPNSSIRVVVDYCGGGICPRANIVSGPPRTVSAISTGNTSVRVVFNEPVFDGTTDILNFSIIQSNVNSEASGLPVLGASLSRDMTTVTLETASQSQVTYTLICTGIQDLAGNVISPPSLLVDPTRTDFAGTPANNGGPDSDGDGLADAVELRGWTVSNELATGDVETREVTSEPGLSDTDGDGIDDLTEFQNRSDPRRADSDGDTVSDNEEYNVFFSNMTDQDSDDDTIDDFLEISFFKTSPILADTDGDGLNDNRELFDLSRDPSIADLPRPRITIGQVRLVLDERYTFTNENGETESVESSSSSSLASSASTTFGRSDTHEWGTGGEGFIKAGGKVGYDKGVTAELSVEGGYSWSSHDDNSVQVTNESSQSTQQAFEDSLSRGRELSSTSSVTREVLGARIDVDVTIESAGDIAFTISNLEVTALQPSLITLGDVQAVGSLVPASQLTSGDAAVFNLGPLVPQHGPIVFSNTEVFPSLVEELMESPRGLLFRIANFDLTDELGRNFAFASQEARDRCVGIVINRGDDDPVRVLVALNGQEDTSGFVDGGFVGGFDANGRTRGIPMDYVLQDIMGLQKNRREPDGIVAGLDYRADSVASGDDQQLVPRGTEGLLPHTLIISAGQNGVLDTAPAGDDRADIVTGYETSPTCGPVTVDQIVEPLNGGNGTADTLAADDDIQLIPLGSAVSPGQAIVGPGPDNVVDSLPGGDDRAQFPGQIAKASSVAEAKSGNGIADTAAQGDDVQLIPVGTIGLSPLTAIVGPGPNGSIDTSPAGDDVFISVDCGGGGVADGPEVLVRFENRRSGDFQRTWALQIDRNLPAGGDFGSLILYPGDDVGLTFIQDVDNDGVLAQAEFVFGSSDTIDDTDADGIDDFVEISVGWTVAVRGQPLQKILPNPSVPDSDGDGLTDWQEQDLARYVTNPAVFAAIFGSAPNPANPISSNPRLTDSDNDGIPDKVELDGYIIGLSIRAGANDMANTEALGDDVQKVFVGSPVFDPGGASGGVVILPGPNRVIDSVVGGDDFRDNGRSVRTNPLNADHDGDTRPDGQERDLGGDPTNINDSDDFRDTDRDGLSDAEEAILGWDVIVRNGLGVPSSRHVTSNKFVPDTDLDGLPDLLERLIGSDPTREDTDGDGITDYNEFDQFAAYVDLGLRYPGFVLNGSSSLAYGTSLNRVDTDGDTLSDQFEAEVGWRVFAFGDSAPREVNPSPVFPDSDLDGLRDDAEFTLKTDPHDADTDDDDRLDGADIARCRSNGALCIPVPGSCADCEGSNPLRPDVAVTITYEFVGIETTDGTESSDPTLLFNDWDFQFGFRVPGSELHDTVQYTFEDEDVAFPSADCPARVFCEACQLVEILKPEFFPATPTSTTLAMVPGDLLILEGDINDVAACSTPPTVSTRAPLLTTFTFAQLRSSSSFLLEEDLISSQDAPLRITATLRVLIEVR